MHRHATILSLLFLLYCGCEVFGAAPSFYDFQTVDHVSTHHSVVNRIASFAPPSSLEEYRVGAEKRAAKVAQFQKERGVRKPSPDDFYEVWIVPLLSLIHI